VSGGKSLESSSEIAGSGAPTVSAPLVPVETRAPEQPITKTVPVKTAPVPKAVPPPPAALTHTGARSSQTQFRWRPLPYTCAGTETGTRGPRPGARWARVGTHGPSGLYEKELVLDISQRLAALLEERMGSEVILTRT
jgi:hypothetical protein